MKVVIMSGIPGSGKTTFQKEAYAGAAVYSSDDYFRKPCPKCQFTDGPNINLECAICKGTLEFYDFKKAMQGAAHQYCLRGYTQLITSPLALDPERYVVVDNTNTTAIEIAPYAQLALAFGNEVTILTIECPVHVAMARQTHGVPQETIERMFSQLRARILPTYWNQQTISIS
jgi:predicted kinase